MGRPLQVSSLSPSLHTHLHRKELSTTCHGEPLTVKNLCEMETSGHCSLGWGAWLRAEVAPACGLMEGEPGQPYQPSLPPAPRLDWSSSQAAWSPAPAHRTALTLSATLALTWSTSRPATQAACTERGRRLWTKARWVRPLTALPVPVSVCLSQSPPLNALTLWLCCLSVSSCWQIWNIILSISFHYKPRLSHVPGPRVEVNEIWP